MRRETADRPASKALYNHIIMLMQDVLEVVRKSGIPYTIVVNDLFFGWYGLACRHQAPVKNGTQSLGMSHMQPCCIAFYSATMDGEFCTGSAIPCSDCLQVC